VAHQLRQRRHTVGRFSAGMRIFVIGLSWKVLLADQVAPIANSLFDHISSPSLQEAWLGLLAYGLEIYFDFGGYSTMAVGLGLMIGFTLPRNFRIPYSALSITAFWRRWHMSLSAWLRDYVYIPLGGNRGTKLRTYANLWTVFLLCGLWHGASWTFVIWGAHHGLFLVIERAGLSRILERLPRPIHAGRGVCWLGLVPRQRVRGSDDLVPQPAWPERRGRHVRRYADLSDAVLDRRTGHWRPDRDEAMAPAGAPPVNPRYGWRDWPCHW
jgi:hypothetical protein